MCCCDYDPPEFYRETKPKAKKQHRCCECGRTIGVGENYRRAEGLWDGDFQTFKACSYCYAAWSALEKFDSKDRCICLAHGGLWENFLDYARDIGSMPLFRLYVSRVRDWRFRRGPRKGQLMSPPVVRAKGGAA